MTGQAISEDQLKQVKNEILIIQKEFHRICEKYNIRYFLFYGTLLGAVRHQGFIPWDDDCDVGMMREDFDKFKKVYRNELSSRFFFQDRETDPAWTKKIIKIRSNALTVIEESEKGDEPYHHGVFVDIFVFDYYPDSAKKTFKSLYDFLQLKAKRKLLPKRSFKRTFYNISLIPRMLVFLVSRAYYSYIYDKTKFKKSNMIGMMMFHEDFLSLFNANDLLPIDQKMLFENEYFYVPHAPESVLKVLYGDYMKLPPENQRQWHIKAIIED